MSDPIRYEFIYNENFCSVEREEHPEGDYVSYEDYARLKAEVEEARKISGEGMSVTLDLNNQLCAENARLKAEVERLTKCITLNPEKVKAMELKMQILRRESAYLILDQAKETERLNAKIERIINAGDAMEDAIIDGGLNRMNEARDNWNAAKEGKQ